MSITRLLRLLQARNVRSVTSRLVAIVIFVFITTQMLLFTPAFLTRKYHEVTARADATISLLTDIPKTNRTTLVREKPPKVYVPRPATLSTTLKYYGLDTFIDRQQALLAGIHRKTKGHLTIGIPTVHRQKGNYLIETVMSLISNMNADERLETTIVIFLADFEDDLRKQCLRDLLHKFQRHMDDGLIQVIHAPREFYPNLEGLKRTYNHPENKVKWRSKQNYDYAFLFKYSVDISEYYMQLEDDVVTIQNYIQIIKSFIASQTGKWVCLEFSELGYIGKVYHSKDLDQLAKTMMLFYQEQPPDETYLSFNILLLQFGRIIRKPTIFQHMGYHSSLSGKIQPLKDTHFVNDSKQFNSDNPPGIIYTNFTVYEPYKPHFAYDKHPGYFWAKDPQQYMYLLLVFDRPEKVNRVSFTTGSDVKVDDYLRNGMLEISATIKCKNATSAECVNYVTVGNFTSGMADVRNVTDAMNVDVSCIRVTMTKPQVQWIVFREIAVFVNPK